MDSLRKCTDIAYDHPELARNIESVCFQADRLDPFVDTSFEAWNKERQEEFWNVWEEYVNDTLHAQEGKTFCDTYCIECYRHQYDPDVVIAAQIASSASPSVDFVVRCLATASARAPGG
ncbi:uncharacterized protein MYCFIDRAFT_78541 [Pseudocercospora fijiensis CIRAD86]|uniref:Uncharacterized protein n=1 Tax=Pseudocercospora fijiensis (strain CIRAD86) TaxID=383855 RepID=N1QBV3_PSEFD|nr:uncharacterized protein MYCFIDRAFT_78541 [Pseudocercospora fijiensis CIRAD86]EME89676.1 hypothetical protein MYCFIDRAFT_78541 [Pseudocercospora fijiensis CIRAD86]